jgi:hypothetical protein
MYGYGYSYGASQSGQFGGAIPTLVSPPVISVQGGGDPIVGATLEVSSLAVFDGALIIIYRWYRDGILIPEGGSQSEPPIVYTIQSGDEESDITVRAVASNDSGDSLPSESNAITVIIP